MKYELPISIYERAPLGTGCCHYEAKSRHRIAAYFRLQSAKSVGRELRSAPRDIAAMRRGKESVPYREISNHDADFVPNATPPRLLA
jgi:hypothetical protein